jgi:hypothetical protein
MNVGGDIRFRIVSYHEAVRENFNHWHDVTLARLSQLDELKV